MGGGGGSARSIGDIQSLVNRAKEELRESERIGKPNVFISFAFEDLEAVNLLRGQAKNDNTPLDFNDWSVSDPIDSERATYIKEKISDRIVRSSVTVVYLSEATQRSPWVAWEIEESIKLGKRVIGVYPGQACPQTLPEAFMTHGIKCVAWADLASTISPE